MATVRARRSIPRSVAAAAVAALATISLAACGDDDGSGSSDTTIAAVAPTVILPSTTIAAVAPTVVEPATTVPGSISLTVGQNTGPDNVVKVALGSQVTIVITNPTADDEFHLHGYDLGGGQVVPAGQTATFSFEANKAGTFELESHITEDVYMVLEVA
jgi:hypothetical protein